MSNAWLHCMPESGLIVEDHPLFRDALIQLVRGVFPDVTPVAASSAEEGLKLLGTLVRCGWFCSIQDCLA